jgi:hypothetical protein
MLMLPTHLPLNALDLLIRDHIAITANDSEEYAPLELLTGYYEDGEFGGMPFESEENNETDPVKRLKGGERLAIQLHSGSIESGCDFIDGEPYSATDDEAAANEETLDERTVFPDQCDFFGVGVWLDGGRLAVEPVRISGDMNGNICVARVSFPASLLDRTAAYLHRIGKEAASCSN